MGVRRAAHTEAANGGAAIRRLHIKRGKSASKAPSLDTVFEAVCEGLTPLSSSPSPATFGALTAEEDALLHMSGAVIVRFPAWGPLRGFVRRPWCDRFAVLIIEQGQPPCVLLFCDRSRTLLQEEITLHAPLQLHCLAPDDSARPRVTFSLSSAGLPPMEFGVASEELRSQWVWALGESMSPRVASPARSPVACTELEGGLRLMQARVADTYRMGKVLSSGTDYMVVEGLHVESATSHALKLLKKGANPPSGRGSGENAGWLQRGGAGGAGGGGAAADGKGACGELWHELRRLCGFLGDVYEAEKYVCIIMEWGTHSRDGEHLLGALVLEALRLLHELLPIAPLLSEGGGIMLCAEDVRKLIQRKLVLDWRLEANLFL